MSGLKTSLAAFALLGALSASAEAQGVVPGGWSTHFGYQPLGGSSVATGSGYGTGAGAGAAGFGGFNSGYGYGGYGSYPMTGAQDRFGPSLTPPIATVPQPGYANGNFLGLSPGMPQTSINADPLMGLISKSVRRSKRH